MKAYYIQNFSSMKTQKADVATYVEWEKDFKPRKRNDATYLIEVYDVPVSFYEKNAEKAFYSYCDELPWSFPEKSDIIEEFLILCPDEIEFDYGYNWYSVSHKCDPDLKYERIFDIQEFDLSFITDKIPALMGMIDLEQEAKDSAEYDTEEIYKLLKNDFNKQPFKEEMLKVIKNNIENFYYSKYETHTPAEVFG